jgi:hypothetical protein
MTSGASQTFCTHPRRPGEGRDPPVSRFVGRTVDVVSMDKTLGAYSVLACRKAIDEAGGEPGSDREVIWQLVTSDADSRVNFYSDLPGTPPYQVPVGAPVAVTFEEVVPRPTHPRMAGRRVGV